MNLSRSITGVAITLLLCAAPVHAQISLQSAVNLALKNSPKVRSAQAELAKTQAVHSESKDAYVPMISTTAGYGQSTGAPLGVPVIFSISAQSLIFSYSQRDYIRSTDFASKAAEDQLRNVQSDIVEDTTNTYIALDNATERGKVLADELALANRLVNITTDRISAGVDPKVELPRSHRTATQIRLQQLQVQDEILNNRQHLSTLTGLPAAGIIPDHSSIPDFSKPAFVKEANPDTVPDSDGIKAAFDLARSKQYQAFGDHRYLLRPQITLNGNYSRVDAGLSSYASYYPRFAGTLDNPNSQNSLSFGLQFTIPLLDLAHHSKARQSAADAVKAYADAEAQRGLYREGRAKLQNVVAELDLRAQLARDDREIAADQLEALKIQLQADASNVSATPATPKDQVNAELQERQKYLDVLNSELQLQQTEVRLLRQRETLAVWLTGAPGSAALMPSIPSAPAPARRP